MLLENQLFIRLDHFTPVVTRILMGLPLPAESGLELIGRIAGPFSVYARTLPTTVAFRNEAPSKGLQAVALFPDFCGWSADHPHLYRVTAELRRDGKTIESIDRIWGVALLRVRRDRFYWEGRRWVMRAIEPATPEAVHDEASDTAHLDRPPLDANFPSGSPTLIDQLRELDATRICRDPTLADCQQADKHGIRLVARIAVSSATDPRTLTERLKRLARHPSVILAWLDGPPVENAPSLPPFIRPASLRLAGIVNPARSDLLPTWAQVGIIRPEQLEAIQFRDGRASHPLLVLDSSCSGELAEMRRECDRLQASVARLGDFSGFLIGQTP